MEAQRVAALGSACHGRLSTLGSVGPGLRPVRRRGGTIRAAWPYSIWAMNPRIAVWTAEPSRIE